MSMGQVEIGLNGSKFHCLQQLVTQYTIYRQPHKTCIFFTYTHQSKLFFITKFAVLQRHLAWERA